jgi:Arm DNA-binding domain
LRYYLRGKERLISLGPYPYVSLQRAREKREEACTLIVEGIDPAAKRKAEKLADGETFEAIAEEWLNLQTRNLKHAGRHPYWSRIPASTDAAMPTMNAMSVVRVSLERTE